MKACAAVARAFFTPRVAALTLTESLLKSGFRSLADPADFKVPYQVTRLPLSEEL
jgi:hypothetical protein